MKRKFPGRTFWLICSVFIAILIIGEVSPVIVVKALGWKNIKAHYSAGTPSQCIYLEYTDDAGAAHFSENACNVFSVRTIRLFPRIEHNALPS